MVRPIMKDVFFLGQKSEPATKADVQVGRDLRIHWKRIVRRASEWQQI